METISFFQFPEVNNMSPTELYRRMSPSLLSDRLYVCAPVTSAVSAEDFRLDLPGRKKVNRERALVHLKALYSQKVLDGRQVILPVDIGSRKHSEYEDWGENDYYLFMLMVMLGIHNSDVDQFIKKLTLSPSDIAAMHAYGNTLEQRIDRYTNVANRVVSVAGPFEKNPATILVFPEAKLSPGCHMEITAAKGLAPDNLLFVEKSEQGLLRMVRRD